MKPLYRLSASMLCLTAGLWAAPPAWWSEQGIFAKDANGQPLPSDNFAVANVGQAKNLAKKAYETMKASGLIDENIPTSSPANDLLVQKWKTPAVGSENYAVLNQGQLKNLAKPFYDRLAELGYAAQPVSGGKTYPWDPSGPNPPAPAHYAAVNLGQLKNVFSFRSIRPFGGPPPLGIVDADGDGLSDADELALGTNPTPGHDDTDGDGIPDGWEVFFGLDPLHSNDPQTNSDGDHLSDLMEFLLRSRPDLDNQDMGAKLAAGGGQTLHTLADGTLQAWGDNRSGQSGASGNVPVVLRRAAVASAPVNVVEVASGQAHTLAVTKAGLVYTWGDNEFGQLGDGTRTGRTAPQAVAGLTHIVQVAAGDSHSLALDGNGVVWAWGANHRGQSAAGTAALAATPQAVTATGFSHIVRIGAGARYSVALDVTGKIWVWGDNGFGQLAAAEPAFSAIPLIVSGSVPTFKQIAAGRHHVLALDANGTPWAWGANFASQLGNNDTTGSYAPVQLASLVGLKGITAGGLHSLAITSTNGLVGWGANERGQLGLGSADLVDHAEPVIIPNLANVSRVTAGQSHSVVLKSDASLLAWGDNTAGRLGVDSPSAAVASPTAVLPPE